MDIQQCENLLYHYERVVLTLHECHKRYAFVYRRISNIFHIFNIILSSVTGTTSVSIYNDSDRSIYEIMNIFFIFIIAISSACQKIIDPSKKYERFRNASEEYLKMFYDMKYKTTFELKIEDELKLYVKNLNIQLEDMRVKFPFINDNTYDNYKEKMNDRLIKSKANEIPLTEIIQIENNINEK